MSGFPGRKGRERVCSRLSAAPATLEALLGGEVLRNGDHQELTVQLLEQPLGDAGRKALARSRSRERPRSVGQDDLSASRLSHLSDAVAESGARTRPRRRAWWRAPRLGSSHPRRANSSPCCALGADGVGAARPGACGSPAAARDLPGLVPCAGVLTRTTTERRSTVSCVTQIRSGVRRNKLRRNTPCNSNNRVTD